MDGPHTASKALGISRDGETVVGTNDFVGTLHAMRVYVWYALNEVRPGDEEPGVPPLFNEFQCMEDLGLINPKRPSSALAASDMDTNEIPLEDYEKYEDGRDLVWGGSTVVGSQVIGRTSNGIQWLAGKYTYTRSAKRSYVANSTNESVKQNLTQVFSVKTI